MQSDLNQFFNNFLSNLYEFQCKGSTIVVGNKGKEIRNVIGNLMMKEKDT
jgi:hypothetical protein